MCAGKKWRTWCFRDRVLVWGEYPHTAHTNREICCSKILLQGNVLLRSDMHRSFRMNREMKDLPCICSPNLKIIVGKRAKPRSAVFTKNFSSVTKLVTPPLFPEYIEFTISKDGISSESSYLAIWYQLN